MCVSACVWLSLEERMWFAEAPSRARLRKRREKHRDDHLRGRQEWTGWRVSPTLLSQKGLYMSARSFVCFASCTFAMEVWGGEKVYPGTTDSEPLLGWGQNELLKPKQTIWEKVTWFLIQNKCSLLKQSFDGVYKHVIRSKKSCGLFRILKMLLMKFSVRIWLAIRKAPLQCHLVERICSDCIWVYHLDIFTLKKKKSDTLWHFSSQDTVTGNFIKVITLIKII